MRCFDISFRLLTVPAATPAWATGSLLGARGKNATIGHGRRGTPSLFFVSADSKGVTAENSVSVASKGLKVAVLSMTCGRLISVDSKRLSVCVSGLESTVARGSPVVVLKQLHARDR